MNIQLLAPHVKQHMINNAEITQYIRKFRRIPEKNQVRKQKK